ncbi:polysaccharide ABC transporter ATP-binding protein [Isoptericola halotolerans]|uniref:Lipopolysaccharide transport system ATP-binding protein n=1 Tax=Isoptericola halotolerans TaxID=300560 RepID=A0ABX2A3S2_9MICO|nr:lipopolysaccharide transport system ATP-binding protein [Isoptericola halotolerans]
MSASRSAVSVRGLGKTYRIGRSGHRPTTVVEAVAARLRSPWAKSRFTEFDALTGVDLDVPWGEALGIVGRNGAGKSTLLKLLTRVTAPTRGRIELAGRMGSLLEVGTGFSGELTGRENIYLNGAILGMSRREIRSSFDEIVAFSGVEKFLDTPVKRYSSGMYVRLAFSVAAHLRTEILAIDEVLAVGDAEFQRKSLAKMRDVAKDGRTVLYVSHLVPTVTALCTSAVYLDKGRLTYSGSVDGALDVYRRSFAQFAADQQDPDRRPGTGQLRAGSVVPESDVFDPAETKRFVLGVGSSPDLVGSYFVSVHVNDASGAVVAQCDSRAVGGWYEPSKEQEIQLTLRAPWLKPGRYTVDAFVCQAGVLDAWEGAATFEVLPATPYPEMTLDEATAQAVVLADYDFQGR